MSYSSMKKTHLSYKDPLSLTLAADFRCCKTNYVNDHIWQLDFSGGEPPALSINTSFGLRVGSLRIFPRIIDGKKDVTNPDHFTSKPFITQYFPNYISIEFSPFIGLDVVIEYWVPDSNTLACRSTITNRRLKSRKIDIEWATVLNPLGDDMRMTTGLIENITILKGKIGQLVPILLFSGGSRVGQRVYPSLIKSFDLHAGSKKSLTWVLATKSDERESVNHAQHICSYNWDAEIAKIEHINSQEIEIETGNPDWNTVFALSQRHTYGCFHSPNTHLSFPSFVLNRLPDQGYSTRGDGTDYDYLWNGQPALETYYLIKNYFSQNCNISSGLLINFLSALQDNKMIGWKPSLSGKHGKYAATPLLATIAISIFNKCENKGFLDDLFEPLLNNFYGWFGIDQDRDQDGFPEWDSQLQFGFESHPLFSPNESVTTGVEITFVESPAIIAYLYRECCSLIQIANVLNKQGTAKNLAKAKETLLDLIEETWSDKDHINHYRDRDTHISTEGFFLGTREGSGEVNIDKVLEIPDRLSIKVINPDQSTKNMTIFIHGTSVAGEHRVERIPNNRINKINGTAFATSQGIYKNVESVEAIGLSEHDIVKVSTPNQLFTDITLLLPLWAKMLDDKKAKALIEKTIANPEKFWLTYGLPSFPLNDENNREIDTPFIHPIYNSMLGEALIHYGYNNLAVELVTKFMGVIINNLKSEHRFRQYYRADTGKGFGAYNYISGNAPIGLFLMTLGVDIISPTKIRVGGENLYPWHVIIRYRGLTISKEKKKTTVTFPDNQTITIDNSSSQIIELK